MLPPKSRHPENRNAHTEPPHANTLHGVVSLRQLLENRKPQEHQDVCTAPSQVGSNAGTPVNSHSARPMLDLGAWLHK